MAKCKMELGRDELKLMLDGTLEFPDPSMILDGVSAEEACREVSGLPYTIAALVSHLHYWQQRELRTAHGEDLPMPDGFAFGVTDFPMVQPEDWDHLRSEFLESYEELLTAAERPDLMQREPKPGLNVGCLLANLALHNAYHLGQVVLLRRMMGNWNPVYPDSES